MLHLWGIKSKKNFTTEINNMHHAEKETQQF
jgi:hypothetical protein